MEKESANEPTYTVEMTKSQLLLLERMTEGASRTICGQLDTFLWECCLKAYERHNPGGSIRDFNDEVRRHINGLRKLCWNQEDGSYYGSRYDEDADMLYDMHRVLRKFRYDNILDDDERALMRNTVMANTPTRHSQQPLINIETKKIDR